MSTVIVKVGPKGSITLPEELLIALQVAPGGQLSFSQLVDGTVIVRSKHRNPSTLAGLLTRSDQPHVEIDDLSC